MNHIWEYINTYSESTFEQLEHELLNRDYGHIRKCPNYEDCLSFCNSMNALNSSKDKITPQSKFVNKHIERIERLVFEVHYYSSEKQQIKFYELRIMVEWKKIENEIPLSLDRLYINALDIDEDKNLNHAITIEICNYMKEHGLRYCKWKPKYAVSKFNKLQLSKMNLLATEILEEDKK